IRYGSFLIIGVVSLILGLLLDRWCIAMAKKKRKANPHCPVVGCRTSKPHIADPIVKALMVQFAPPENMTEWVLAAMAELRQSIMKDLEEKRVFGWHSRMRQPEELYIRTLYALFVASDKELPHIISGDMPNGFSRLYSAVNRVVLEGRGKLLDSLPGLHPGTTFKPIDTLNDGAHASFRSFLTCMGWIKNPQMMPQTDQYLRYLNTYCNILNRMHDDFKANKDKKEVLEEVKKLYRSGAATA